MLLVHTELAQSVAAVQPRPVAQPAQPPPQSTPVSVPFFVKSAQVAAAQLICMQTWLWQSWPLAQLLPVAQPGQLAPPQSMSDSSWFKSESEQLAEPQRP